MRNAWSAGVLYVCKVSTPSSLVREIETERERKRERDRERDRERERERKKERESIYF
jgi:hypothetical protein